MIATLIRIDAQDASGGAVPIRISSHDLPEACHLGGDQWEPALATLPDFALDFFGGGFAGQVTAPRTAFTIATLGIADFGAVPAARARFADARVRIWVGDLGSTAPADLGPLTLRFDGRLTGEPEVDDAARTASFEAAVQDSWADKPLLGLFAGTGGIEGPADLTGQPKPLVLGNTRFAGGVLIDSVNNVWMVSSGSVQAVNAVYDRLASLGSSAGNYAGLAELLAAPIPNGSWATCLAQGLVRLGTPPDGRVSFDVAGSNSGAGGYVRRPGAIIRRIADLSGSAVNAASLTALDTARPYNLQMQLREQVTARELIGKIADSVAAVAGVSLTGELFAQALSIAGSGDVLNADDSSAMRVASVEERAKAAPNWRLATEAELTFEVHSADEAAFAYRWQGEYSATRVYRIDDVVSSGDGASWVYINGVAAAGQALPIWPITANLHWENFSPPVDPASIGLEPGATRNVPRGTYSNADTYVRGDYVLFSGSAYQLIVETSTGNPPPDALRWALIASAGSGTPGDNGLEGITVIVTNEAHTVATAANGSGGNYSTAGGQMTLRRGATLLEPTFSIAAATPNTGWISINSAGVYTVSDPGVDLATATIRATWAGVNYDRTYTLAKSKQGVDGPTVALVVNNQAFTFTNGVPNPASQTITFEALLTNISGTATWSTTPSVTLGGSGNTRTLSIASFGVNRQVTVQATLGGITDRITVVRLERDLNTEVVLQGTLAARPTTGQFVGQNYLVTSGTDAGVLYTWNGSAWVAGPTRGAPTGTLVGGVEASGLVDDAARAKADAAQSLIDLTAIASDSVLTRGEKINVRERRDNISNEFPIWRDRGIALGISPDTRASYQQSYDELIAYLTAVNVNANSNTNITRADFVAAFNNYALARERVIDAVAVAASQRASWTAVSDVPAALTDIRAADGRLNADRIGWIGLPGQSVNDLKPQESNANRTENRVAASILSQGALATSTIPYVTMNGRQRLDSVDVYYADGIYVSSLRPQEVNSNRTEGRVASSVLNQTSWATLTASTNRLSRINDFGRISDPTIYNAQAILGPRNVSAIVPTYTVNGSNVTINLPAHTRRFAGPNGPLTLSYGAASGVEPFNAYWAAFVDDPNLTGFSSPPVQITNDPATLLFPGRYHIASGVTPGPGGSGGSTGSGGGGGSSGGGGFTAPNVPPGTNYP